MEYGGHGVFVEVTHLKDTWYSWRSDWMGVGRLYNGDEGLCISMSRDLGDMG